MQEFLGVRLLAIMEMRSDCVLKKMHDQIAQQHQQGAAPSAEVKAFRHHLYQGCGQHESCAESHKIAEIPPLPTSLHNDGTPEDFGGRSSESQQYADSNRIHGQPEEYQSDWKRPTLSPGINLSQLRYGQ